MHMLQVIDGQVFEYYRALQRHHVLCDLFHSAVLGLSKEIIIGL